MDMKAARKKSAVVERPKGDGKEIQLNATLSQIDGLRVIAVLEKSIERLQLLSLLNYDAYPNSTDQYLEIRGLDDSPSGVGTILDEQKRLESRYEELLVATARRKVNPMDPELDAECYSDVDNAVERQQKEELQSISLQLKEFSKQLCRQLKENPNDSDNWKKVLNERGELTTTLTACVRELNNSAVSATTQATTAAPMAPGVTYGSTGQFDTTSQKSGDGSLRSFRSNSHFGLTGAGGGGGVVRPEVSYEIFAKKVIDEQKEKTWADEIVKREKETNMNVKHLQNEVTQEKALKEKEIEDRQARLNELKTRVRRVKQETKEHSEKKKAETKAQAEANAREAKDKQRRLQERIQELEKKLEIENEVFAQLERHLNSKSAQLQTKTSEWTVRQVDENKELDDHIMQERKKRDDQIERLKSAEERHAAEVERHKERQETEKKTEQDQKRRDDLYKSEYQAATKLQAAFKAFLVRKMLTDAKKKRRKKRPKKKR